MANEHKMVWVARLAPTLTADVNDYESCLALCKTVAGLDLQVPWTVLTPEGDVLQGNIAEYVQARQSMFRGPHRLMSTHNILVGPLDLPSFDNGSIGCTAGVPVPRDASQTPPNQDAAVPEA